AAPRVSCRGRDRSHPRTNATCAHASPFQPRSDRRSLRCPWLRSSRSHGSFRVPARVVTRTGAWVNIGRPPEAVSFFRPSRSLLLSGQFLFGGRVEQEAARLSFPQMGI